MTEPVPTASPRRRAGRPLLLVAGVAVLVVAGLALDRALRWRSIDLGAIAPSAQYRVAHDLVDGVATARLVRDTRRIVFGTEEAEPFTVEPDPRLHLDSRGLLGLTSPEGESVALACGDAVEVRFDVFGSGPRRCTLEAANAAPGGAPQRVVVTLNDGNAPVAEFTLARSDAAERHTFELPGDAVRDGRNVLRFSFARTEPWRDPATGFRYRVAAAFVSLDIERRDGATADGRTPDGLVGGPAPPVGGRSFTRGLVFDEGTRAEFAVRVPRLDARLHASLYVDPADRADRDAAVVVRLRTDGAGRIVLARGALHATSAPETRRVLDLDVDLSLYRGEPGVLEFEAAAADSGRPLRIFVADPQVAGFDPPTAPTSGPDAGAAPPPALLSGRSLVLLSLDAAGARHFTAYGASTEDAETIDRLALTGVTFEGTTAPASYTLASVGSLLTGLWPERHGVVHAGSAEGGVRLSTSTQTLAERLKARGYSTAAVVTNPNAGATYGYGRGFDTYLPLYDPTLGVWDEGVPADALAPVVGDLLEQGKLEPPFFLWVHVFQPHAPYTPPARFREGVVDPAYDGPVDGSRGSIEAYRRHEIDDYAAADFRAFRELYRANLRCADAGARAVLEALAERGRLDDALVTVVSDHGEALGEHGSLEHGDTVFGEQVEVPWILRLPPDIGWTPSRVPGPCSLVDVAPTLLSLLGIDVPPRSFDGVDLVPRMLGAAPTERPLFFRSTGLRPRLGVHADGHALHVDLMTRQERLYDLATDPGEEHPLERTMPVRAEALRALLARHTCGLASGGERTSIPADVLEQMTEIGYLHVTPEGEVECPLFRRPPAR